MTMSQSERDNLDELRHIEGFPIGEDEDLHALSDPPYYTAYPNPHIAEFIAQHGKPYDEVTDVYRRGPYVADVSEGKTEPIYMAHTYHAKAPAAAVAKFISHYCEEDGIVLDVFCGTGMTGVAAIRTGRSGILIDLSPIATSIASVLCGSYMLSRNIDLAISAVREVGQEVQWMYQTRTEDRNTSSEVDYILWSDVFRCPYCKHSSPYVRFAYKIPSWKMIKPWRCPQCDAQIENKTDMEPILDRQGKVIQMPFLINFEDHDGKSAAKEPDDFDTSLLDRINRLTVPSWFPEVQMLFRAPPWGDMWRAGYHSGIETVADFFTKRSLYVLALLWERASKLPYDASLALRFAITSVMTKTGSRMHNVGITDGRVNLAGQIPNTLQPTSINAERNLPNLIEKKLHSFRKWAPSTSGIRSVFISTQSATDLSNIPNESIDYVFVDPPFGGNIIYSEMNFIWEAWLRAYTNSVPEAICSKVQNKDLNAYRSLMLRAFQQLSLKLKPGRWITVEFHNSSAAVWNAIQDSLAKAGFIVAQVAILDKGQGTYKQQTAPGAVKNDLVINAYKPRREFETRILQAGGIGQERAFIAQHLDMLPLAANVERTKEMLYSKMLAYYVQHGYEIQYNADQFYQLLQTEFREADGYWFRDEAQLQAYEQARAEAGESEAQAPLFIVDERSAIQWLKHFLRDNPSTLSEIHPEYLQALQTSDDQIPDLRPLLEENFGESDAEDRYHWPHPNLQARLEQERQTRLLRLFNEYLRQAQSGQKLKDVRKEAVLAGFAEAYREKRFGDILTVGRKLNKSLVEASAEIYDFVDIAEAKVEA
jgi:DNA modification methylase